jgi:uncharacterized membrane protein
MTDTTLLISTAARITAIATALTAVGTGVMAGVFFAFSTSVMPALSRQPVPAAIAAMQQLNLSIVNPLFLLVLGGSTICCLALLVTAPFTGAPHVLSRVAGSVLFLVGAIGLTSAVNVPMNDALAAVDPGSTSGQSLWKDYLVRWTRYNHLRAASSVVATALLIWSARS